MKSINTINRYSKKCSGFSPRTSFGLFDKMIVPILTYGAEIWGFDTYKQLENVQIRFCKKVIGVPKKTSNEAVLGECGRYPLMLQYTVKCIKYWLKLLVMPNTRYPKACYNMIYILDGAGKKTWATSVKTILMRYGYGIVWLQQGVGDSELFVQQFKNRLQDNLMQEWLGNINNSSKLAIYCTFKSQMEPEKYLTHLNVRKYRGALAKFRCSSHRLAIESGRYENILLEDRICLFCKELNKTVIEDEYHFLLFCPTFQDIREKYIEQKYWKNPTYQLFIDLMSNADKRTISNLSCFLYQANELRNDKTKKVD